MGKNMVSQYTFLVHLAIQSCRGGAAPVSEARKGKFGTGGMIRATLLGKRLHSY